jgi:hypothetical protein
MNAQAMFDRLQDLFPDQAVKLEITYKSGEKARYWAQVGEDLDVFAGGDSFEEAYCKMLERYIRDRRKADAK